LHSDPLGECEPQVAKRSVFVINIRGECILYVASLLMLLYVNSNLNNRHLMK